MSDHPRSRGWRAMLAALVAGSVAVATAATAHAFPTHTEVSDSFDRSALGASWGTGSFASAIGAPTLGSNRLQFPSTWASAHYAASTFGGTQEAYVLKRSPGFIGVTACVQSPGLSGSGFAVIANGSGTLTIARFSGGTRTDLVADVPAGGLTTWDSVGIRVAAGTVSAYAKKGTGAWQLAASTTHAAAASCSGHVGVVGQGVSADDFRGGGTASGPADTTPPSVSVTQPAAGATVSGTVALTAAASDDSGVVAGVRFQVDGQDVGAEDTVAPWSTSWATGGVANGTHSIRAIARDAAGNQTTSAPVAVTVSNQVASPEEDVSTAQGFADSIGVNTHFAYGNDVYCRDFTKAAQRLAEAKLRQIRETVSSLSGFDGTCALTVSDPLDTGKTVQAMFTELATTYDVRTQLVLNTLNHDQRNVANALTSLGTGAVDGTDDLLDRARILHQSGALRAVEGPNEYDTKEPTTANWCVAWNLCSPAAWSSYTYPWREKLRPYNETFYSRVRAVPALDGVPVTLSSFARGFDHVQMTNSGLKEQNDSSRAYLRLNGGASYDPVPFLDEANSHYYFGAGTPEATAAGWMDDAKGLAGPAKPALVTETGYNDHLPDQRGMTPAAAARYLPRLLFTLRNEGAKAVFLYQLADTIAASSEAENSFGLLDASMNPKPAYQALKRLLLALQDPTGAYTAAQQPQIGVQAGGADVRTSVLKRRNGAWDVAIWRPVPVFDDAANADLVVPPISATVTFPAGFTARTMTPSKDLGQAPAWSGATGAPLNLALDGELVLVRLTPSS